MARNFTDKGVAALKPRAKLYAHPDPQLPGHYIRVMPTGTKSFVVVARDLRGKQIWSTLGKASDMGIESAREEARKVMGRIRAGQDKSGPVDFETASKQWLKRHVEAKGLRSDYEYRRMLRKHVLPVWGTDYLTPENDLDPANWAEGLRDVLQVDGRYYAVPMNYATLPALSWLRSLYLHTPVRWPGPMGWPQFGIHLICVGLPIVWGIRRATQRAVA